MITVIGWYGTETMGDIAILDGILQVLKASFPFDKILIGSLYPFHTQRTINENYSLFEALGVTYKCVFDVRDVTISISNVEQSDLLVFGGGPLMDCYDLYLMERLARCAYKKKIPFMIMGCGIGPLHQDKYRYLVKKLLDYSIITILRDELSIMYCRDVLKSNCNAKCLLDPSVISIEKYKANNQTEDKVSDYAVINLREYPSKEYGKEVSFDANQAKKIIKIMSERFENIKLVPMHTFSVGFDDRAFFTRLLIDEPWVNIEIMYKPLSLYGLYEIFRGASSCIGMRYHSIIMQTLLNGNNIILDYTNPQYGKIQGFIEKMGIEEDYRERYISIFDDKFEKNSKIIIDNLLRLKKNVYSDTDLIQKYKCEIV